MERNAVDGMAIAVFGTLFDFDAVGVVRAYFMQGNDVGHDQADNHQRDRNDVEGEESVQRGIGDDVVAAYPYGQLGTDERNGREQIHNNLCAPVRHLAPWQQIAEEGFAHETEEDGYAEDPDQFARLAVRTVKQAAQHVQVHHHEEH